MTTTTISRTKVCVAHKFHSPRPQGLEDHHVFPMGWGGAERAGANQRLVWLCATGHDNVHYLLAAYEKYKGTPPWPIRRSFGPGERALAAEGWRRRTEGH